MAGLPRSGSTVLAALLNQHPEIYASPSTEMLEMLYRLNDGIPQFESYRAGLLQEGYHNVLQSLPDNFYSHIDKPVIIDKHRAWGTPYNFANLAPILNKNGKVILTVRPLLEVLASFMKVTEKTKKETGALPYLDPELFVSAYRNKSDAQVEFIMQPGGIVDTSIFSIWNLLNNHKEKVLVVWYEDLIETPQDTMDKIYDFLEVSKSVNNFNKIKEADKHDDVSGYGLVGLHSIRPKLKSSKLKPEDYLSDYIIQKYKNTLDFIWS